MASIGRGAPLQQQTPKSGALVEDPDFQDLVETSRSLAQKVLQAIPDTYRSCIHTETLTLNSPNSSQFEIIAAKIGISPAPVLRPLSENFTLNTCLKHMNEGLHQFKSYLDNISERLQNKSIVADLIADIKELVKQINKMQKMLHSVSAVQTATPAPLRLHGEYEVQVAAHLTLKQLQSFGRDAVRCLRSVDCSEDDKTES